MKIIRLDKEYVSKEKIALCLGYFDGLHKGHQALIDKAISSGYKVGILTFDISPKQFINKKSKEVVLDENTRNELLEKMKVDYLFIQKFDEKFSKISAAEFINYLKMLNPSLLVVGYDYRFGINASGDISFLKQFFKVAEVEQIKDYKGKYSTSRLIESLSQADIKDVISVLGRPYSVNGKVMTGLQNGRKIGFKTANMKLIAPYYSPKNGVYACYAYVNNKKYYSMVNIGVHPTIQELKHPLIEVHIIDFDENIYGSEIRIEFIDFIREEIKFSSLDKLRHQLEKDVEISKNILLSNNGKY